MQLAITFFQVLLQFFNGALMPYVDQKLSLVVNIIYKTLAVDKFLDEYDVADCV